MADKKKTADAYEGIWLVSDQLDLAADAEVDALEEKLGMRMPTGYRRYVTTLGNGEYCNMLGVRMPDEILEQPHIEPWAIENLSEALEDAELDLTEEDLMESIYIAVTSNADEFLVHPHKPDDIIAFPRDADRIWLLDTREVEFPDLYWATSSRREKPEFRAFQPWRAQSLEVCSKKKNLSLDEIIEFLLKQYGSAPHHREDHRHATFLYLKAVGGYAYLDVYEAEKVKGQPGVGRVVFYNDKLHEVQAGAFHGYLKDHGYTK